MDGVRTVVHQGGELIGVGMRVETGPPVAWTSARAHSGILVTAEETVTAGPVSPCAFHGNATRCNRRLNRHLPNLSQAQLAGLVLWVCGAILASACQAVAAALSTQGKLVQPAPAACGNGSTTVATRAELPCPDRYWTMSLCFAPLLRWVLSMVAFTNSALALGRDGPAFVEANDTTAIVIFSVYRGCAIPVAWRIATIATFQRGSWIGPDIGTAPGTGSGGP